MQTILEAKECVLEELPASGSLLIPPPRSDASHCYWLIHDSATGTLGVGRDGLPDCPGDQIFRLSLLMNAIRSKYNAKELQMGDSDKIGTELLCEDEHVKIWEFRLAPQERCEYHRHLHPYFFLNLTESWTQELNQEGDPVGKPPSHQTPGQCTVMNYEDLSAHSVKNIGKTTFLQFIVEFPCK